MSTRCFVLLLALAPPAAWLSACDTDPPRADDAASPADASADARAPTAQDGGEGAPDAAADPIPADALYLDPARGSAENAGTREAPWPGLEETISAGLLAGVEDGRTLLLLDGHHGSASFEGEHEEAVTIHAAPGARPTLSRLEIRSGRGFHLRGLTVSPSFGGEPYDGYVVRLGERGEATDLVFEDGVVFTEPDSSGWTVAEWMGANDGVLLGRHGDGLVVRRTHVHNVRFGISIAAFRSSVEGSLVADFPADGIRVTRDGDRVIDTVIKNAHVSDEDGDANHDDAIQCFLFNVGTGTVRDVTIRGNVVLSYEGSPSFPNAMQGIGFFDGPLVDFVVEDNVVFVDHWHGVSLYDAQGSRVSNNVAYSRWTSESRMRPWVMLGQKMDLASGNTVEGNSAFTFDFAADRGVVERDNEVVEAASAEARFVERLRAIEARWGALFDGAPRVR